MEGSGSSAVAHVSWLFAIFTAIYAMYCNILHIAIHCNTAILQYIVIFQYIAINILQFVGLTIKYCNIEESAINCF